ncbi:ferredoxin [Actinomycetospora sp. C-140]
MPLVSIDHTVCSGTEACHQRLPAVFGIDDDGYGVVLDDKAATLADIVACAKDCPTGAISVVVDQDDA